MNNPTSRRLFLQKVGLGSLGAVGRRRLARTRPRPKPPMRKDSGAAGVKTSARPKGVWKPVSDRKIRVGIVGNGVCKFGPSFGFQDHPNVTRGGRERSVSRPLRRDGEGLPLRERRILRWKNWSRTTASRRCSWPPTPPATPSIASTCSSTASTWPARCRPCSARSKTPSKLYGSGQVERARST